jgi:eukaryotic-like serine/threonine-protein kinase
MRPLRALIHEIHRRSLWQVLGIYAVTSWMVYQVVLALYEGIGLPGWVPGTAIVLLLIGLPIVLATAFVQEGGPGRSGSYSSVPGLEGFETGAPIAGEPKDDAVAEPVGSGSRLFTWSRAVTGGLLAFAALGLASAGFMGMRTLGIGPAGTLMARGDLGERDLIVLADFRNATRDSLLGGVVTEALRIDLGQSRVVRVADPALVNDVLRRMERDPGVAFDRELALELAVREGLKAVLAGEVGEVRGGYLLTAEVLAAEDGSTLASFRKEARDSTMLIDAIGSLSAAIREKVGESLNSTRSSEPLERVTTSSLPALRKFTQALQVQQKEGDEAVIAELFREATQIDTTFAMAWRKLGVSLANSGTSRSEQIEAISRAYRYRDRLPEQERYVAIGTYHHHLTGDYLAGAQAYRRALEVDPENLVAGHNLGVMYGRLRQFEAAEEAYARNAERHETPWSFINLAVTRYALRKDSAAAAVLETAGTRYPDNMLVHFYGVDWAYLQGEPGRADSLARALVRGHPGSRTALLESLIFRATLATVEGRIRSARSLLDQAVRELEREDRAQALQLRATQALAETLILGDTAAGAARLEQALRDYPLDALDPFDRPYLLLAQTYVRTGRTAEARRLLAEYDRVVPSEVRGEADFTVRRIRALMEAAEGNPAGAIQELALMAETEPCTICNLADLGLAYESAGRPEEARLSYSRFLETPHFFRLRQDAGFRALVLERLAELHDQAGRTEEAAVLYQRFIELWKDADPELQPRVDAARRALTRLTAER